MSVDRLLEAPVPLDALDCPLTGINLIEASAGTGKTWTIAALYCRLLLEEVNGREPPLVDAILVVTYTRAATAELRDRLRRRLEELLLVMQGLPANDPFLQALSERFADTVARERAIQRLTQALRGFDAAAIYTIHGFCQRVLTDAAFESGQPFQCEALDDDGAVLIGLVEDYWRERVVNQPVLAGLLAERGETPEAWLAEVRPWLARPYLKKPELEAMAIGPLREAVSQSWLAVCAADTALEDGLAVLAATPGFKANVLGPAQIERYSRQLRRLVDSGVVPEVSGDTLKLARLSVSGLASAMKKGFAPPEHVLFTRLGEWSEACQAYQAAAIKHIAWLKLGLIDWLGERVLARREIERTRSFDDLLTDLARALDDPEAGPALAERIGSSFRVALIDEFQDTDPVQYGIFRKAFITPGVTPVFLVGDPKQAIYSFRGADIFAYLEARRDVTTAPYSLDTNRRSVAPLVEAVNDLFAHPLPFLLERIQYQTVKAASSAPTTLTVEDDRPPFVVQWLDSTGESKGLNKSSATRQSVEGCCNEIARLLGLAAQGRTSLQAAGGSRPLSGGDIAVLVATHRQGDLIRLALRERGINSVALTQESVFASTEAAEMLAVLRAWAEPSSDRLLRVALSTRLCGFDAASLLALVNDEAAWERRLAQNSEDHQRWLVKGFMTAWHVFLARDAVVERVIPTPGGERAMTNFAHLAELLQKEGEQRKGLVPLLAWFEARVADPPGGEEAILRLESDASLVKIVTIHTSKGLQYPVVFCPFLWDGALERRDTAFWRFRADDDTWLMPDTLAETPHRELARREMLAEKLRLLYVALTRAQCRHYLSWGYVQKMQTAALSWLWHGEGCQSLTDLEALALDEPRLLAGVEAFVTSAPGQRALLPNSEGRIDGPVLEVEARACVARTLSRSVRTPWWVASFTSLTRDLHSAPAAAERPDHEQGAMQQEDADIPDRFAFPRGARPGTCLHAIFESIDFMADPEEWRAVVDEKLARFGIAELWRDTVWTLVCQTLAAPLDEGISLNRVAASRRLVEMEFLLPVGTLNVAALRDVLSDPAMGLAAPLREAACRLDMPTVRGFVKGFMDLVFELDGKIYLVDYKSNHLGNAQEDYSWQGLADSIAREHYYLQYLLYCVALQRYFTSRGVAFADRFGGVRYLYLRGIDNHGNGIWRDQPSTALLQALDALFTDS